MIRRYIFRQKLERAFDVLREARRVRSYGSAGVCVFVRAPVLQVAVILRYMGAGEFRISGGW